jgi:hypothetical protein
VYLTQIPAYAKEWLYGDESVVTLILTVFSVGIALGSMLCERMSGRKVEIGLVPEVSPKNILEIQLLIT